MEDMLLIDSEPGLESGLPEAEQHEMMSEYFAFTQRIVDSGEMVSGEPLRGIDTATTVAVRAGKTTVAVRAGETTVTDGPFAETKEVLGGYYLVDVDGIARAQELAAEIPTAKWGRVEVRPLMELPSA